MLLLVGLPVAVSELGDEGTQLICRSLYRKTALQHISLQGGAGVWGVGSWDVDVLAGFVRGPIFRRGWLPC